MSDLHSTDLTPILTADPGRVAQSRLRQLTAAFEEVVNSGWYILGTQVEEFENAFSNWQECQYTIGVANGTDAVELCLRACGVRPGDLVIVPAHTAVATATAVVRAGAVPLLVDIDCKSYNIDLKQVEELLQVQSIADRVSAIISVHLYGNPCDMDQVTSIAAKYKLKVIEDCSQAHGALWRGKRVGNFGDAAAFSCYPTKNLGALGDAGLCITNSDAVADYIRLLRQYGWRKRYISSETGMNSRLDSLQAALLRVQLKYLDHDLNQRREIAENYSERLKHLPIKLPATGEDVVHAFHQYTIQVEPRYRDALKSHLERHQVFASILYPSPIHLQPAYQSVAAAYPCDRSDAEQVCERLLCLPIHPLLTHHELLRVTTAIEGFNWR